MKKIVVFQKESFDDLPINYDIYLDSFICNCIKSGDCRLSHIINNYTKDYDISNRPFQFSEFYTDCFDNSCEDFSSLSIVKLTFSSFDEKIMDAFCKGVQGKTFEVKNVKLKVLNIITPKNECVEQLYSLV